jgi:hypothetical protein
MRSLTRHRRAAPLPRCSLSTTSRAFVVVSSDATTNEVRRRECIATACCAQGCSEGLQGWCALCSVLTALVPFRSNTEMSKRDLWVVWLQSRSVQGPQSWLASLLVSYRPLAHAGPQKPSRSLRASAAAVGQIPLPVRPPLRRPDLADWSSAALLGPPYVLFSRPQALVSPPITCTHCSRKRWPGLAAEASITITLCCSWAHHHRGRPD